MYHDYSINFAALEDRSFASLAIFGIGNNGDGETSGLINFSLNANGSTAGTFTYQNTHINYGGALQSFDGTAQGVYTEIVGVGGIYNYYTHYKFCLMLNITGLDLRKYIAA